MFKFKDEYCTQGGDKTIQPQMIRVRFTKTVDTNAGLKLVTTNFGCERSHDPFVGRLILGVRVDDRRTTYDTGSVIPNISPLVRKLESATYHASSARECQHASCKEFRIRMSMKDSDDR